ncbi:hypothetical protein E2C01_058320 [Portunus trituberculatus]|uniref:Uncharacterized protein n=1 Tax=Portunus trituberculatus TaxID=210409 RepID=A0A5B7H2N4_PORTR|nr:hypothetical protein [Portunus trituberculatus]
MKITKDNSTDSPVDNVARGRCRKQRTEPLSKAQANEHSVNISILVQIYHAPQCSKGKGLPRRGGEISILASHLLLRQSSESQTRLVNPDGDALIDSPPSTIFRLLRIKGRRRSGLS